MNIVSKLFCRIFQGCFYIAQPFLPYREPKIYKSIDEMVENIDKKSVLLVTDGF